MERWQKIEELFQLTLDCAESDRAALLAGACAGDESLREEVESLLTFHERSDGLIDSPAVEDGLKVFMDGSKDALAGSRVGAYKIIREIGRGGMGAVYLASRADDFEKRVAIKLIKRGMDTDEILTRFRNERQILANLDHPNIARLLDGGTTTDGLPYFVMEYIEGKPVDEYCDTHKLSIDERLHLFRSVCSAVSYAHQHLTIHRDLKPGNILVTDEGVPKLLDFGISKLLASEMAEASAQTATALRVMTPEYASPEQIRGQPITTASDVYSLGVVLYELLTGRRPYHFKNKASHEIAKIICETEPDKPSLAVSRIDIGSTADGIDGNAGSRPRLRRPDVRKGSAFPARAFSFLRRGYASEHLVEAQPLPEMKEAYSRKGRAFPHIEAAEPQKLTRQLRGDLDNIILMAIRKEPERRYSSVEQLSSDVRRHLEDLPVIARKDIFAYRTAKFIRRNRISVAVAALLFVMLLAGIVAVGWEAHAARIQRERAERRFNDVRQLANSFMFEIDDELKDLPGTTHARALLVQRALKYLDSLAQESGEDRSLQHELALAYWKVAIIQGKPFKPNLGDTEGALTSYRKAQVILESLLNTEPKNNAVRRELGQTYKEVGSVLEVRGDMGGSLESQREAIAMFEALVADGADNVQDRLELAKGYTYLSEAWLYVAEANNSVEQYRQALESAQRSLSIIKELSAIDPTNRELRRELAASHEMAGYALWGIGDLTGDQERYRTALEYDRTSKEIFDELTASEPTNAIYRRDAADAGYAVGRSKFKLGDVAGALETYGKVLPVFEELAKADPTNKGAQADLAAIHQYMGEALAKTDNLQTALEQSRQALNIYKALSQNDPARNRSYLVQVSAMIDGILSKMHKSAERD